MHTLESESAPPVHVLQPVPLILLTAEQAAQALNVSERLLWDLTKAGEIPRVKIGRLVRYRPADLEAWAIAQSTGNPEPSGV